MLEWRLDDVDLKVFGGPEWLALDWDQFATWPWGKLDELELGPGGMGMSIRRARLLTADGAGRGLKAALWLARMTSGDPELKISWDAFDVQRPLLAQTRVPKGAGDAEDPPAGGSPDASAGESTSAPDSSSSSPADGLSASSSPA